MSEKFPDLDYVKAHCLGGDVWGHSMAALIDALPETVRPQQLRDKALELDQAYIPSRYPNAHPAGFPGMMYTKVMADRLLGYAKEIVGYCRETVSRVASKRRP